MPDLVTVPDHDRSRLSFKFGYAFRHPGRVIPYARRRSRDALLGLKSADHVSYYRGVMKSDTERCPEAAVGSHTREEWLKIGQLQFDYLVGHGLQPGDRMLEIGCGNLRAGRLFIDYLGPGNYYGIDISPEILLAAQRALAEFGLQDKVPHLMLVDDLKFAFLPTEKFTVMASGAMIRLKRNESPDWPASSEYASTRRLGMNTYAEKIAPRISANEPVMFMNGVSRRRAGGMAAPVAAPVAGSTA